MMDFSRMLERLKAETERRSKEKEGEHPLRLTIQYDKGAKDIGVFVKLNNLMKTHCDKLEKLF